MGRKYTALLEDDAFQHFAGQLYSFRDAMSNRLLMGSEEQREEMAQARATVKLIDALLTVPDAMIREGKLSEEDLRNLIGEDDDG